MMSATTRTVAVTVPDWPLVAALDRHQRRTADETPDDETPDGAPSADPPTDPAVDPAHDPVLLLDQHRVTHASAAAQGTGALPGMTRRAARAACPEALVLEADREHESALFELVAAAVDTIAAGVDVLRPGVLLMSARGPARHQGGEEVLAERILDAVAELTGWDCAVGIADGPFAALLASPPGRIVREGRSADYLAPHPIAALAGAPVGPGWGHRGQPSATRPERRLDLAETVDLLQRLGITTLGELAALPSAAVADRFGPDVATLHLLARGEEPAPPATHHPTQPILAETTLETPLVRTDQAAFIARPLAEELHAMLVDRGLVCTRLRIVARTEGGEEMERTWRHDGALSVADVVDRIRWQCDGWITRSRLGGPATGAITRIGLHPLQLAPAGEGAPALWGSAGEAAVRASRAFARAQGLAGEDAVQVPALVGGRLLADEVQLVPWRGEKPARRDGPWPGSLPRPVPATVFRELPPVVLEDAAGRPVVVTARGLLSASPARLLVTAPGAPVLQRLGLRAGSAHPVLAHGAPAVIDERWWTPHGARSARLQLVVRSAHEEETAVLALSRIGSWMLEGLYD
ncbi:DNA repair nucleotidyltransferase [Brachybacterium sp. P6-10-X1]|uniref:DNA polymerase Y family protein n=1 Tax=Brachybacterium sp. P6-10-X1 TaxID=1903186 RepID=UPI000971901C|nr:DNA polymerase Y family protein [Brachybacterium sp. P6-10-X1]APX31914.1 DNA repair nucleotidyltransferase [Brachybacterium sp. P6-10-X1]